MSAEYAVEVTVWDPSLPGERVLTFTSGLGFTTTGADTPATTLFAPRVRQPALLRRDIFDAGTTGGASRVGFGELVLANEDGALDAFRTYALDGRTLVVRTGTPGTPYPAAWPVLFVGTMEQAETTMEAVVLRLRDRQAFAAQPLQRTRFAGDNVLPDGVEGIATDLKDKPKPVLFGWCRNITPVLVNTSRLIYQVHDGEIRDVQAVYDSGALLAPGPDYADLTEMQATPPAPGTYRKCKPLGCFRLGSAPFGQVTCDAITGVTPYDRTASAIFAQVLTDYAGVPLERIMLSDLATLAADQPAQLGFYYTEPIEVQAVLDDLAASVGAWWGSDALGRLRLVRLEPPAAPSTFTLAPDRIERLVRVPMSDPDAGLPVREVTVRAVRNHTVQTTGLVGVVGAARRARLAQPYQDATAADPAVLVAHPLAPERTVETGLACLGDAEAEAARLLSIYGTQRDRWEVTARLSPAELAAIDLGTVVTLQVPRYGLGGGVLHRIIGYQLDPERGLAQLTLWG